MILVNIRKDSKTGQVKTENHLLPTGGFFNVISSPHMFFEIVMYVVLLGLLPQSFTWKLVAIWVFSNQVTAIYFKICSFFIIKTLFLSANECFTDS